MPLDKMKLQGDLHDIESLNFSGTFGLFHVTREVLVGGEGGGNIGNVGNITLSPPE